MRHQHVKFSRFNVECCGNYLVEEISSFLSKNLSFQEVQNFCFSQVKCWKKCDWFVCGVGLVQAIPLAHIVAAGCDGLGHPSGDVLELAVPYDLGHLSAVIEGHGVDDLQPTHTAPVQVVQPTGGGGLQRPDHSCLCDILLHVCQRKNTDHLICPLNDLVALLELGYVLELFGNEGLRYLLTGATDCT